MLQEYLVVFRIKHIKYKSFQIKLFKRTPSLGLLLPAYQLFQHQFSCNKENHFEK